MTEPCIFIHGIDEAGYGPLLGPLVVARADFVVAKADTELELCSGSPLRIADSKKIIKSGRGFAQLEATVLGLAAHLRGQEVSSVRGWLEFDGDSDRSGALAEAPWYDLDSLSLPLAAKASAIGDARRAFADGFVFRNGTVTGMRLRVFPERRFNLSLEETENKHETLFQEVASLLDEVLPRAGCARVTIDKLGGRTFYADKLSASFPFRPLEILNQSKEESRYRMELNDSAPTLRFWMKGDDRALEVALASMLAKYTREILMAVFNEYWCRRIPGLKRTAGYYQDGRRFLADLSASGKVSSIEIDQLTRRR
ncbi:MAG: hypothetical protein V3W41_18550 [Planctomycetota bacterium]